MHMYQAVFNVTQQSCVWRITKRINMCVCLEDTDLDLPAAQWVLVDLGILWVLHLLSGQTYPAVLSVQIHRHYPVGGQKPQNSNIFTLILNQLELQQIPVHKHLYPCVFSVMGFLCPLYPFQGYGVHPSSCASVVRCLYSNWMDSYLSAFSEGHFMAISSIHQFSILTRSCSGAGACLTMNYRQANSPFLAKSFMCTH